MVTNWAESFSVTVPHARNTSNFSNVLDCVVSICSSGASRRSGVTCVCSEEFLRKRPDVEPPESHAAGLAVSPLRAGPSVPAVPSCMCFKFEEGLDPARRCLLYSDVGEDFSGVGKCVSGIVIHRFAHEAPHA